MQVYRVARSTYINDLSGNGARIYGGRWNHKGTGVIYASESRSLVMVECLVHVPLAIAPADLRIAIIEIPDRVIPKQISKRDLPSNWRDYPAPQELLEIGTNWVLKNESLLLRVPSAVVENEFNILINPAHSDINTVKISRVDSFTFDRRLMRLPE